MQLKEIKDAVESGKTVHWANTGYIVFKDSLNQWLIVCLRNFDCVGLTHKDGVTMNEDPEMFYISGDSESTAKRIVDKIVKDKAFQPKELERIILDILP